MSTSRTIVYVRTYLTRIIIIVGALSVLVTWYFSAGPINSIRSNLQIWNVNIETFSLFVGLLTVYSGYLDNVRRRGNYWQFHVYSMVLIIVWIIFGTTVGAYSTTYQNIYIKVKGNITVAMLGQLGFYVMSGAYRTFRIRNFRTALFALCTTVIMAMNSPFVARIYPDIGLIIRWFLQNPSSAGARAVLITNGLGAIILGVRILLGVEKGALRMTEEAG
jgi:hypothetical protein